MDSPRELLHQGGRKLNDQYFIIKARLAEGRSDAVEYHAFSPRNSVQYTLTLAADELDSILAGSRSALFSDSATDRKTAHQAVIDSLQFEDRMLAHPASPAASPSRRAPGDISATAGDAAVEATLSPSKLPPAAAETAGVLVLRVGRKLNGKYFIITMRQVQHASDPQKNALHVLLYSPATSQRVTGVMTAQEAVQLLERAPAAVVTAAPASFIVNRHADAAASGGAASASPATHRLFYEFVLEALLVKLAPAVCIDIPEATLRLGKSEAEKGNAAFLAKQYPDALAHYTAAATAIPESTLYRLSRAAVLTELGRLDEVVQDCKRVVAIARRLDRRYGNFGMVSDSPTAPEVVVTDATSGHTQDEAQGSAQVADPDAGAAAAAGALPDAKGALHPQLSFLTGGVEANVIIGKAYARMAGAFLRQNRASRAMNALVLSIKARPNADVQLRLQQVMQLVATLNAQAAAAGGNGDDGQSPAPQPAVKPAPVPDVEDVLSMHVLSRNTSAFKFSCTGCGECCRSADHIFLSPADMYRMTRTHNMVTSGIATTRALRAKFGEALKFTTRELIPICQLRPVQSSTGQCHFAYPLYRAQDGHVLSFEETQALKLADYKPVHPSEYNLTEEEEAAAMQAVASGSRSTDLDGDDSAAVAAASASQEATEDEQDASTEPTAMPDIGPDEIMNSYGRQALGCRLDRDGMPTLCSTYPIARELNWVDFWHDTSKELELGFDAETVASASSASPVADGEGGTCGDGGCGDDCGEDGGCLAPDAKSLRVDEQRFVTVKSEACEGFFEDGKERTLAFSGSLVAETQSVDEFVAGNDMYNRWRDDDWFKHVVEDAIKRNVARGLAAIDKQLTVLFVQAIATIWYDFDSLPIAKSRPFKSWQRVKRTVEAQTTTLLNATESFLTDAGAGGTTGSAEPHITQYKVVLRQLGLL